MSGIYNVSPPLLFFPPLLSSLLPLSTAYFRPLGFRQLDLRIYEHFEGTDPLLFRLHSYYLFFGFLIRRPPLSEVSAVI